jgi:hypothetical protein
MAEVIQRVSEQTRKDGRESVPDRVQRLSDQKREIARRKQEIECQLLELDASRMSQQSQLRKRRMDHKELITKSGEIQAEYTIKKAALVRELNNVVEELSIVGQSLGGVSGSSFHNGDMVLLRIEELLKAILERIDRLDTSGRP